MADPSEAYLRDLGMLLRERLESARREAETAKGTNRQFEAGRYRAYREVLGLMLVQAEAFERAPAALSLDGLERGRDLGC